ncbi:MAG: hypothetical protein JNL57_12050 [Bacteroidetes bacterium]|nr:hypothetical protein [Bacteroidota bacterium]
MKILGISAWYHDSAAAFTENGKILFAAQEERYTRRRHDAAFPAMAISAGLKYLGLTLSDIDLVVYYEKPFLKFDRLLENYFTTAPRGFAAFCKAMPVWLGEKLFIKNRILRELNRIEPGAIPVSKLRFAEHHLSHAASAFYSSPFHDAAVLTVDGVGEWATTTISLGTGRHIKKLHEIRYPHSLGLFYSAFTAFLGFKVNSGEYKVMGLAPYGKPVYKQIILEKVLHLRPDGSFQLQMQYFGYTDRLSMFTPQLEQLFGQKARMPETELTAFHYDLAASVQAVLEEAVLGLVRYAVNETGNRNLCMAGGVALNCVANARIRESGLVDDLWVQPAAGDAGAATGAALALWHSEQGEERIPLKPDGMQYAALGEAYNPQQTETILKQNQAVYTRIENPAQLYQKVATLLAEGLTAGWFQGRMEFGPRALGQRSILADARREGMREKLNATVKNREMFRPFAPVVMEEFSEEWFSAGADRYMMQTVQVQKTTGKPDLPAITHVDGSARLQLVNEAAHPELHGLLTAFHGLTGCPVLVNTSFNVRGEPLVENPQQAWECFMRSGLDVLCIGEFLLIKAQQTAAVAAKSFLAD